MDPRRRTLAAADPQPGSSIPVPSSALKRPAPQSTHPPRFSLAPQRVPSNTGTRKSSVATSSNFQFSQQSDGQFFSSQASAMPSGSQTQDTRRASVYQAPYTVARQSISNANFNAASRAPMSASRNDQTNHRYSNVNDFGSAATPNFLSTPSASRASSAGPMQTSHYATNALLFPPPPSCKDPRPRDKKTIASWQQEVFEFLQERGYPELLTLKTLQTPTTKDFHNMFKFVVQCSDPAYRWGTYGKKFEDDVLPLLKVMGYFGVEGITKSGLQAPGSMHTWPTLLAVLHWIVTTIKLREEAMMSNRVRLDTTIEPSMEDPRSEDLASISQWMAYLGQTYPLFLQSEDFDRELYKPPLEEFFQKRKDHALSEIERLETRVALLEAEHARLTSKPSPLHAAKKEHEKLGRDAERFLEYIGKLRESNKKSEKQNEALKKNLELTEAKLKEAEQRKDELTVRVVKQNISEAELQQMMSSRSILERTTAAAASKHMKLTEDMLDLEVKTQQASDRVEKILTVYKNKAVKLGLIPRAPEPFEHVDFSQNVNGAAPDVANMLPDPTVEIKPALVQLKKNAIDHRLGLTDQVLSVEEKLADLTETLQDKRETLQLLENSVQQLAKQLEDDKEKFSVESSMLSEKIESIIRRVNETESAIENGRMTVDHEIQALRVRLDETQERVAKLTKDNVDEMNGMMAYILSYKERIREKSVQLKLLADSTGGPGPAMGAMEF